MNINLPSNKGSIPIWSYWLTFLIVIFSLATASIAQDGAFCSAKALDAISRSDGMSCFEFWLNRYQTLIAGSFALIAAAIGFQAVRRQIDLAERLASSQQDRDTAAARAVLPLSLSALCSYAENCVEALKACTIGSGRGRPPFTEPLFPTEIVGPMQECVRALAPDTAAKISSLISFVQVFRARLQGMHDRSALADDVMYDAVSLYSRASSLFELARDGGASPRPTAESIETAMHILRVPTSYFPDLMLRLERQRAVEDENNKRGTPGSRRESVE